MARVTSTSYDFAGQVSAVTTPDGVVMTYVYDAAHQLISVTDTLGDKVQYTFDPNGTLVRSLDTAYDAWNRVNSVNNAGSVTQTVFNAVGELVSETNPKNATTTHQYDALAHLLKTVDALSGTTGYSYDAFGNLTTQVHTELNIAYTTAYSYDAGDRMASIKTSERGSGNALSRGGDANALVFLEVEQMTITGDDEIGVSGEGAGAHMIVVGIDYHTRNGRRAHAPRKATIVAQQRLGRGVES